MTQIKNRKTKAVLLLYEILYGLTKIMGSTAKLRSKIAIVRGVNCLTQTEISMTGTEYNRNYHILKAGLEKQEFFWYNGKNRVRRR